MMKLKKGMKLFIVEKEIVFIIKELLGYCGRGDKCINCKGRVWLIRYYDDELQEEISDCYTAIEKNFIPLANTIQKLT